MQIRQAIYPVTLRNLPTEGRASISRQALLLILRKECLAIIVHYCTKTHAGIRRITTFRSTMDRIYDGGSIRL